MSELAHFQQQPAGQLAPAAPAPADNRRVVSLVEWGQAAKAAHEVAVVLVQTPFVPVAYRDNPYAATAAILAGDEVGLNPMSALAAFDVIEGRAAARAITLRAIVQSRGHDIWVHESTDQRCIVRGRRAGTQLVQESVWTVQRARTMGLAERKQWKGQPTAMLVARATAECCRMIAADAILGIPYSVEELQDQQPEPAAPDPAPARTARRRSLPAAKPAPAPTPEAGARPAATATTAGRPAAAAPSSPQGPPLPGEEPEPAQPARTADGSKPSAAQNRKMHALFRDAEVTDRDERLVLTGLLLGRQLDTSAGLTPADANTVIDQLERLAQSGHADGLAGAVTDLLNQHDLQQAEAEIAEEQAEGEQDTADDDARGEA